VTDLLVRNASEVVVGPGGDASDEPLETVADGAVAVADGRVAAVGPTEAVVAEHPPDEAATTLDADGRGVVPGFVDPHTHALFAGDRSDEFAAKVRGASYEDLLASGGGIHRTVRAVRESDPDTLVEHLLDQLDRLLAHGTTTAEVKSGYGLDRETELRMLEAIAAADARHPVDVVPTFMGAHAVPDGVAADDYVDRVVEDQLPAVADQGIAEFCDVFCERGVFDIAQSRRVLSAGRDRGLAPKVHAEELSHLGGARLAAEVGAVSADHLLHATREDAAALRDAGTVPVLLPGTAFGLGADYADPGTFEAVAAAGPEDAGPPWDGTTTPVALATDLNPNCYSHSMGFACTLACVEMGLPPAAAIVAATRNAALAIGREDGTGTLRVGAPGDLAVVDGPSHVHVPYSMGVNAVGTVVKGGEVVVRDGVVGR